MVVDIRCRSDRDKHLLTVSSELHVTGPMPFAMREVHNVLRRSGCLQFSIPVRESDNGVCISYVYPLRTVAGRIEGNSVWLVESRGENCSLLRFAIAGDSAEDSDFPTAAFCEENIAVGGGPDQSRVIQSRSVLLHDESGWSFRPSAARTRHQLRSIACRLADVWCRKILCCDSADFARLLKAEVCEWRLRRRRIRPDRRCARRQRIGLLIARRILE